MELMGTLPFLFAAIPSVAKKKEKRKKKREKKAKRFAYKASCLPHTALSHKLESRINNVLEHKNTGASVTIRSFAREVHKEYL